MILFSEINATQLGQILAKFPILAKPLMILGNDVAKRALERDLGLKNINSYAPRFTGDTAKVIAGYLKPFLPPQIELEGFCLVDRLMFLDKEIRKGKGRWEKRVLPALKIAAKRCALPDDFKKRRFTVDGEDFELDAASPATGPIKTAVDVKRVEARRDIHKRCDEIVNKASKFKKLYPNGKFIAFVYYPFINEQTNIVRRLESENVDVVVFATETDESLLNASCLALKTKRKL